VSGGLPRGVGVWDRGGGGGGEGVGVEWGEGGGVGGGGEGEGRGGRARPLEEAREDAPQEGGHCVGFVLVVVHHPDAQARTGPPGTGTVTQKVHPECTATSAQGIPNMPE